MESTSRRRWLRSLAWLCALLMLTVVAASAWIRLAQPRPACVEWPDCRQHATAALGDGAGLVAAARSVHRAAASLLLPVAAVMVWLAWPLRAARAAALWLLALGLALGVLGVGAGASRAQAVLLGNQLGGWLMLALALRLAVGAGGASAPAAIAAARLPGTGVAALAAAAWLAQAALGALSGSGAPGLVSPLHVILAAAVALPLAGWCGWQARQTQPRLAQALLVLTALQAAAGVLAITGAAAPLRVWLHATLGACGFALLAVLSSPRRATRGT